MANPYYATITSSATPTTPIYSVNNHITPVNLSISVTLASASAATYSVQYTLDDLQGNFGATSITWFDSASASSITASTLVTLTFPVTGIRISASTVPGTSSPQLAARILQAGIIN